MRTKLRPPYEFTSGSTPSYPLQIARLRPETTKLADDAPVRRIHVDGTSTVSETSRSFTKSAFWMNSGETAAARRTINCFASTVSLAVTGKRARGSLFAAQLSFADAQRLRSFWLKMKPPPL